MHRVTTELTYYAPDGMHCNTTEGHCRFCSKTKNGYSCVLYQEQLESCGKAVRKSNDCLFKCKKCTVEKSTELSYDNFIEIYKMYRSFGHSEEVALKKAKADVKGV